VGATGTRGNKPRQPIKTVNLKHDRPTVSEALSRLDQEITRARREGTTVLKVVHGYGSSGAGGEIRIAVQARLREMAEDGRIRCCIFGEYWSKSDEATWRLLQDRVELKQDSDLGHANRGITVVVLLEG
jgi:hypothetical protein